jgi:hypothetical protein
MSASRRLASTWGGPHNDMLGRDMRGATFPDHQTRLERARFNTLSVQLPADAAPD